VSVDEIDRAGKRAGAPAATDTVLPCAVAGVSLWWSDLAPAPGDIAALAAWLSAEEHARAARFGTEALRHKYIAGRATLRRILGRTLGIEPAAVLIRRGRRGRPVLANPGASLDFNVSHTRGGAVFGIATGLHAEARIGVDVEREDRTLAADGLARKFLAAEEQATLRDLDADARRRRFLRYWTCKEAMSKATGDGLIAPFGRLIVDIEAPLRLVDGPAPYAPRAWRLSDIAVPEGFIATLAIWRGGGALSGA
jgi:4'-phosphopantetheinyl transferase